MFFSRLRLLPGGAGPTRSFIMVFRAGFLHGAVSVLGGLLFRQMSRGQCLSLQASHLLVDGGLSVGLDTAAEFALRVTETEMKQISEQNCHTLDFLC